MRAPVRGKALRVTPPGRLAPPSGQEREFAGVLHSGPLVWPRLNGWSVDRRVRQLDPKQSEDLLKRLLRRSRSPTVSPCPKASGRGSRRAGAIRVFFPGLSSRAPLWRVRDRYTTSRSP